LGRIIVIALPGTAALVSFVQVKKKEKKKKEQEKRKR